MGGATTSAIRNMAVAGVNGCTTLFFFGNGRITGAHLTGDEEVAEARTAAQKAKTDGTGGTISILAPDLQVAKRCGTYRVGNLPKCTNC